VRVGEKAELQAHYGTAAGPVRQNSIKSQLTTKADKKILAEAEAEFVAEHPDCAAERAES